MNNGGKILLYGNGGYADATFDSRIMVKYKKKTYICYCINNRHIGFDHIQMIFILIIFSRQIDALGSKKDICIAITTSGNSKKIN